MGSVVNTAFVNTEDPLWERACSRRGLINHPKINRPDAARQAHARNPAPQPPPWPPARPGPA
ncbi:hypothetical protein DKY63_07225 [Pseudomonas putida]|uniref:Uncharacterized protein n=1 Tax=Pseudomonas putida TaxID=303 RepID=A0A2Z4RFB1_PSEPU|nr:hypothetical protein DKY63_07225 [Pseudomonas putida]